MNKSATLDQPMSDFFDVARHFRRSANVEKDFREGSQNGDYILTPTALDSLRRLTEGLSPSSSSRAWTITGPYGVGKSSFALFVSRVFCATDASGVRARELLKQRDPEIAAELSKLKLGSKFKHGFLPILLTARRVSAPHCIAEGIASALTTQPSKALNTLGRKVRATLVTNSNGSSLDTKRVLSALETTAISARNEGYHGVLLIIDELGKLFEYAARYPQRGDVSVLQEIGEYVSRSKAIPTMVVGLLHQSFEEYGHLLDVATRREWSKIQGRFSDIPFLEPADQVIRMIGTAIQRTEMVLPRDLNIAVDRVVKTALSIGIMPPGMGREEFRKSALAAYPLHPLALVAIPYVFRRFGQNERSLFSYLSSAEPFAFQEFLKTHQMSGATPQFIRLADLFDYFSNNFGLGLYRQPQAIRWLEAADVLERKKDLGRTHQDIVKTVGVLNALGQFSHLTASSELISFALSDTASPARPIEIALSQLNEASVLTHRSYNNSYRIWEGSDVDLEERIAEGKRRTGQSRGLAEGVRKYIVKRPMIARRHSFDTGALRMFEVVYVDSISSLEESLAAKGSLDGRVIVCLSESNSLSEQFQTRAKALDSVQNLLFAVPQQIGELRGVIGELAALRWVWENTPELRDDRVARREVSLRITEAEQLLLRDLAGLTDPRPEPVGSGCLWFHAGLRQKVSSLADVSQLFSKILDLVYDKAPRIRNELIVRRTLSTAAAAARRNLIEAMLKHETEPLLGIEGFPPERSIYESVLRSTGIHRVGDDGTWHFGPPSRSTTHNMAPSWRHICEFVFDRQPEPIPLDVLFAELAGPPWGILDGLHPVLLCAFMMVYPNETTLYKEHVFVPETSIADFELMLRRPELFAIAGCRVSGSRALVVDRIAGGLKAQPATVPVVRALFRTAKALPDFAWNTHQLSAETLALREAFNNAKSPERFLFVDVPSALGLPVFSTKSPKNAEVDRFFRALNQCLQEWAAAFPRALEKVREQLLRACGAPGGEEGWNLLRQQAVKLENRITDPQLLSVVRRIAQASSGLSGVESVCALLASRHPSSWSDVEIDGFCDTIRPIGVLFRAALESFRNNSTGVLSIEELGAEDRKRAEEMVRDLRVRLDSVHRRESAVVIRAALFELMRVFDKETRGGGQDNGTRN
jgi:hypothetical protein